MPAIFPRWTNKLIPLLGVGCPLLVASTIFSIWYWFSPYYTDAGYQPKQPVPFSHALHAGDMGLDCRYCHNTVERSPHAAIPPSATCMNCHSQVKTDSPRLALVRASYENGDSIPWVRVHQLPDYAYFDHRPHVAAGVGCASCHGRIDGMTVVEMNKPLSMGWCLDCHREPEPHLRPLDQVTNMHWDDAEFAEAKAAYNYQEDPERTRMPNPPMHCSGCHR
ncbi:hypothetical protein PPSIR1_01117 [Plesiocystis pacifica SIR-1]|uniref:Cytochrome c7-like domain-containing protein n=1 Tax=Plesiocystis pacifica SIR-1 TaxID=391625 RepID=A6GFL9_9BACT|nr:cytochrome c3 family protein [Plesiocystis pacifica]EDM75333.1 hypothetical protein PPSIR1_01117 [Plesiocystis pacifica SIR-1]